MVIPFVLLEMLKLEFINRGFTPWLENLGLGKLLCWERCEPSGLRDLLLSKFLLKIKCQAVQRIKGM